MIPEGNWKARGGEWAYGMTKGTRDKPPQEQVAVEICLLEGPSAGSRITWYGYFGDKTFERTVESLHLLGWKGSDLSDLRGIGETEVYAVIVHEEDLQGETRARVKWINGTGGVALTNRLDAGQTKHFAERMRGRLLALEQSQQRPTGAASSSHQPPLDDDIPF